MYRLFSLQRLRAVLSASRDHGSSSDVAFAQAGPSAQYHAAPDDAALQLHAVLEHHV